MYGILKKSLFISMAGTLLAATSCQMTPKMSEKECVTNRRTFRRGKKSIRECTF